jgi:hypothetical protein
MRAHRCFDPDSRFAWGFLKVVFQGSRVTSDAGLILVRELDERLGLEAIIAGHLSDSRHGLNTQFRLTDLLRQSIYSRLAAPTASCSTWISARARCMGSKKGAPTTGTSSRSVTARCFCSTITATAWRRSCDRGRLKRGRLGGTAPARDRPPEGRGTARRRAGSARCSGGSGAPGADRLRNDGGRRPFGRREGATRERCRRTVAGGGLGVRNSGRRGGRHEVRPRRPEHSSSTERAGVGCG